MSSLEMLTLLEGAGPKAVLQRLEAAETLAEGEDPVLALTILRSLLRDALALRTGAQHEALLNGDVADRLRALAEGWVGERAPDIAEAAEGVRVALRGNANKLLAMDLLMDALGP